MALSIGLIGLPRAGKTTVFNALTHSSAKVGGGGGPGANVAVVPVPDARLAFLTGLFHPKKTTAATVQYTDLGGLSAAGSVQGELGKAVLSSLRDVDALLHVVRAFTGEDGLPPEPVADAEAVDLELALADLSLIDKRLERLGDARKKGKVSPDELREEAALVRLRDGLGRGSPIREIELTPEDQRLVSQYQFLTARPVLIVLNIAEQDLARAETVVAEFRSVMPHRQALVTSICGKLEMELAQLDPDESAEFMAALGIAEPGLNRVIRLSYELLGLISFLTVGPDEVRAWTLRRGRLAAEAAGTVHSDMEKGFIRAQVVSYDDLQRHGSMAAAKHVGKVRLEGRQYAVQDGDIVEFLFNV